MTHRNQETFNVTVMNFRNSSFYVQRQINRVFRLYKHYTCTYIDDIVIFSQNKDEHLSHLHNVFKTLSNNNIAINSQKAYIDYSSITLLKEQVTFLKLFTNVQKMEIIFNLNFLKTLKQLKTYFNLID